jgi:chorismate binding enzyme
VSLAGGTQVAFQPPVAVTSHRGSLRRDEPISQAQTVDREVVEHAHRQCGLVHLQPVTPVCTVTGVPAVVRDDGSGRPDRANDLGICTSVGSPSATRTIAEQFVTGAGDVYRGALGYIPISGNPDLSIVIQTGVVEPDEVPYGVGSAVIAPSEPDAEFAQTTVGATPLLCLLDEELPE